MNLLSLIPVPYRILALAALAASLVALGWWQGARHESVNTMAVQARWDADKLALQQAADEQAARNRDLQRAAELRYVVQAETRDRFIVTTVTELRHDTQNLADCRLTAAAVQRMRDLAACARQDRPASCVAGEPLPSAR